MHKNPYRHLSTYWKIFEYWQSKQVVTREELKNAGFNYYDTSIILSPRSESQCKGDCRGSVSAMGHLYYAEKVSGKRYRLRWRSVALDSKKRTEKSIPEHKVDNCKVENSDKNVLTEEKERIML